MGYRSSSMYASHAHSSRSRYYSTLLLLALGAAMLSVLVFHKLREGRVVGLLLQERERQLLTLELILEKEQDHSKQMQTKLEELKAKAVSLRTQKIHIYNRLMEAENLASYLKDKRQELESALQEQQDQLATVKDMPEASTKANLKVTALTDLLKQHRDLDEAPADATPLDEISNGNDTDESTRKEESSGNGDTKSSDGVKEVDISEQEQGFKREDWVRFATNMDDGDSTGEEDRGMEEVSEEGKRLEEGISQVGNQSAVEVRDETQISKTELLLNSTVDGDAPVMKDEVTSTNTTESNVRASEDGQLGKEDTGDEREKPTITESNVTASEVGQHEEDSSDDDEKDTSGDGEEIQSTTESNVRASEDGQLETSGSDDKNGSDSGDQKGTIRSSNESIVTEDGGVGTRQENTVRTPMEVNEETTGSNEGSQTEDLHGSQEGESTGKMDEGDEQSREGDEEEKEADVSTHSIQQEVRAAETVEDEEAGDDPRQEQEPEIGNSTQEEPREENEAEEAVGEAGDANEDDDSRENEESSDSHV